MAAGKAPAKPFVESFTWEALHFRVRSPLASHLVWLREFLTPHFSPGAGASPPIDIGLEIDPGRFKRCQGLPLAGEPVPTFALDGGVVLLEPRRAPPGALRLWNEKHRVFYEVAADRRSVSILAGADAPALRPALQRAIREYVMNRAQAGGGFLLHASCILPRPGRPMVVAGPRGSGKTSLLLFAARDGARPLANDRVLVARRGRSYTVRGIPSVLNIRVGSLGFLPGLEQRIAASGFHGRRTLAEARSPARPQPKPGDQDRYKLTLAQLCALFGTEQAVAGNDPVVLIPRITRRPGRFALTRLGPDAALKALREALFGASHWVTSTPVFNLEERSAPPGAAAFESRWRAFASAVPSLLCEIGEGFYAADEGAAPWIAAVQEAAGPAPARRGQSPRRMRRAMRSGCASRRAKRRAGDDPP